VIFFVLSGYLISGSIFRMMRHGGWSWRLYLTHRLVRLWIVLVPALLLGAALDFAGLHFHLAPALYAGQTGTHMMNRVPETFRASSFFGNLFFLQGILTTTFGSNTPLWSLANEFWYYILFPCAFLAFRKKTSRLSRVLNAVTFFLFAWFVGRTILLLFPLWLLGTVLAVIPVPNVGSKMRVAAALLYCPILFFLAKTSVVKGVLSDYILGAATFGFLWLLLAARDVAPARKWVSTVRGSARFSYTLYLVHVPMLVLLVALVGADVRWQPDIRHLLYGFPLLFLTIGYAYLVASMTEFRTDSVRTWVETRLMGKRVRSREPVVSS
jgi:peptidoglycan/LPS O-acetylase OafA/YrhL